MSIRTEAMAKLPKSGQLATMKNAFQAKRWDRLHPYTHLAEEPEVRDAVRRDVLRRGLAGKAVPDDIVAPIFEARRRDEAMVMRAGMMQEALETAARRENEMRPADVNPALSYLRGELMRIVQRSGELAPLFENVRSAASVLAAGNAVVDAWREAGKMLGEYLEIRSVQRELYVIGLGLRVDVLERRNVTPDDVDRTGTFADAPDQMPYWVARRKENASLSVERSDTSRKTGISDYDDWLRNCEPAAAFATDEQELRLVTALTTLTPWLPTIAEYQRAQEVNAAATGSPTSERDLERTLAARDAYFERVAQHRATSGSARS